MACLGSCKYFGMGKIKEWQKMKLEKADWGEMLRSMCLKIQKLKFNPACYRK